MPFEPFAFDDSVTRTQEARARVPEGYYLVEAADVQPTPEDVKGTTGIWVTWRIVQGPKHAPGMGVGQPLPQFNTFKKDAQFGFAGMMGAVGMETVAKSLAGRQIPSYQHFQALVGQLAARLKGKRAVALVADQQSNQSRAFSGIESFSPADRWEGLSGAMVVSSNGPLPTLSGSAAARPPTSQAEEDIFADLDSRT